MAQLLAMMPHSKVLSLIPRFRTLLQNTSVTSTELTSLNEDKLNNK